MTSHTNEFGQAIGFPLEFTGPWPRPQGITLPGCTCRLKRAAPEHARELFDRFSHDHSRQNCTYMPTSPAPEFSKFEAWFMSTCRGKNLLFILCLIAMSEKSGLRLTCVLTQAWDQLKSVGSLCRRSCNAL